MESRFLPHLIWTVVALGTFSLGYFAGGSSGNPVNSRSLASSASSNPSDSSGYQTKIDATESAASASNSPTETKGEWALGGSRQQTPPPTGTTSAATPTAAEPGKTVLERAAQAMLMGSDLRRQRTFLALLEDMQPGDAIAIRSFLAKATDQGVIYENLWEQFWTRWGEIDGPGAMKYILETQKHDSVPKDLARVMRGWGASNPTEAAQWLEEHQGQGNLGAALIGLADGYASENLNGATAMVLEAAPSGDPLLGKLMETLSEQAVRQGRLQGLTAWFDKLPAGSEPDSPRAAALGHVYWRLWQADQDKALDWVQQQSSKPWRSDRIVGEIAQRVAQSDPVKAFNWLQNVPPSPKDGSYPGLGKVVETWFKANPQAAAAGLQSLESGAFKDQALAVQQNLTKPQPSR